LINMSAISTALSPNIERDDIFLALRLLFKPNKWKEGEAIKELENDFKGYLGVEHAFSFNSGRSAFFAILEALGIKEGEQILLQAFTCSAAVIPILAKKLKPIFVDIDESLNIDPEDLKKKITPQTKAVMVQHTFGCPAKMDEILKICQENNLFLIEDCAHCLGASFKGKLCGTFGEAAFFSFGRDKVISSVFGGIAVTNNERIGRKIKEVQENAPYPSAYWIFQQLLHPLLTKGLVLPFYSLNQYLGKGLLVFFQRALILSKAVLKKEKRGIFEKEFVKKMPQALAFLAQNQLKKLERFKKHRQEIARLYQKELSGLNCFSPFSKIGREREIIYMKYPLLLDKERGDLLKRARKEKIYLNDGWIKTPIVPPDIDLDKMEYPLGSCPRAERTAKVILNLPTHININTKAVKRIVNFLKKEEPSP